MNSDRKQNSSGDWHVHVQDGAGARSQERRPQGQAGWPRTESAGPSTCLSYAHDTPRCATASHPVTPSACTTAAEVSPELISIRRARNSES